MSFVLFCLLCYVYEFLSYLISVGCIGEIWHNLFLLFEKPHHDVQISRNRELAAYYNLILLVSRHDVSRDMSINKA